MKLIVMAKLDDGSMKQVLLDPENEGVVRRLIQVLHDEGKLPLSSNSWEVKECEGDNVRQSEQLCQCDAQLIRTNIAGGEYCGICEKDLD